MAQPNPLVYIAGAAAALGLAVLAASGGQRLNGGGGSPDPDLDTDPDQADEPPDNGGGGGGSTGPKAQPILVGPRNSPEIAAQLTRMADVFASEGVNMQYVQPWEVMTMRKTPGRAVAIPPEQYWYLMAATLRDAFGPLREAFGAPITVYNGYRPPDYNKAVTMRPDGTWTKGSRHQWAQAVDLLPVNATGAERVRLARLAAALYVDRGHALKMGFGVYGKADFPTGVHLDVGFKRRTWGRADQFVNGVGQA